MEFNEKLQQLRKNRDLTQEELAELLLVSRTAVSKWESGRGYPSIDSLKAISKVFAVSIDELLSGEELITIAEKDKKEAAAGFGNIMFGLLDVMILAFFIIPLFGQKEGEVIRFVSLTTLKMANVYLPVAYGIVLGVTAIYGLAEIVLQNQQIERWSKYGKILSAALTIFGTALFIISQQPYMAFLLFWILIVKGVVCIKLR